MAQADVLTVAKKRQQSVWWHTVRDMRKREKGK